MNQVKRFNQIHFHHSHVDLEPHILLFRRSLKVSQQVQQQRAAAQAQALHMK